MAQTRFGFDGYSTARLGARALALLAVIGLLATAAPTSAGAQNDLPFSGEVVTIVGTETSPEAVEAINAAIDSFERTSGMTVIYTPSIDPAAQIDLQVSAGAPPDVAIVNDAVANALISGGEAQPLDIDVSDAVELTFASPVLDLGTSDGIRYGVPVSAEVSSSVWYKPSIFSSNGYGVPLSWSSLRLLANQMIGDGNSPFCVGIESGADTGWVVSDWIEDVLLGLWGPEVYDAWVAHEIAFSDERVEEAFVQVFDLWSTAGLTRGGLAGIRSDSHSVAPAQGLSADECAMVRQRSLLVTDIEDDAISEVDVFPLPAKLGERPVIASFTWALGLTDRPAVDALLGYLGSATYASLRQTAQQISRGDADGPSRYLTPNIRVNLSQWHPAEASMNEMLQDPTVVRTDGSDAMSDEIAAVFLAEVTALIEGKPLAEVLATIDAELPEIEVPVEQPLCDGLEITISGTDDDDVLTGTLGDDVIDGGAGNDTIAGGGGDDIICGGPGDDTIWGNGGDDVLVGGDGNDKIRGGAGNDNVQGGAGADDLGGSKDDDVIDGGSGDDTIRGGTGDDILTGGTGDEVLMNGNGGEDEVRGGSGNDFVVGGPRPDLLFGGEGDDELKGNSGADELRGEAGDDSLRGGPQPDSLYGGDDDDVCNGGTELDSAVDCETTSFTELECLGHYNAGPIGCVTPNAACLAPQLELETIAGVPMIDPITGEAVASVSYSCVLVCEPPGDPVEQGRCVLALP